MPWQGSHRLENEKLHLSPGVGSPESVSFGRCRCPNDCDKLYLSIGCPRLAEGNENGPVGPSRAAVVLPGALDEEKLKAKRWMFVSVIGDDVCHSRARR